MTAAEPLPGTVLPELTFGPISRTLLALYAGASGDADPVHIDVDFAREAGHPDVFAHGMLSFGVLSRVVTRWAGMAALRSFGARFLAITHVHDVLTCRGRVAECLEEDGERRARIDLVVTAQDGRRTLSGQAVVALSSTASNLGAEGEPVAGQIEKLYLSGNWVQSTGSDTIPVVDPTTEQVVGAVPAGTAEDVERAVAAARAAFPAWAATSRGDRAGHLRRLHDGLAARAEEIATTISTDVGTPARIALRVQATLPRTDVRTYVDLLDGEEPEERVGNSLVMREPVGVVAAVTPWNYPLHQITAKIAPALAAGCTVVLKPSEVAPLVVRHLFEAIDEADLPPGVVNLVHGAGPTVGEALVAHAGVDMVSFTGSVRGGARVAELAARSVKKVTLELGGKSANVLLDDADVATAVKVGVANAFLNGGQTCTAWTRMVVPADRQDEVLELAAKAAEGFVPGDPHDPKTKLGPLVSAAQRDRVRAYIATGIEEGARLVAGGAETPPGRDKGFFVAATVFGDVDPNSTIAQEEIFGPVLAVIPYRDEAEALEIANNSDYGLHGAVWSADRDRALAFARRVRTGQIDVNGGAFNPLAPFGGYKRSGVGREMGRPGLEEYQQIKSIQL